MKSSFLTRDQTLSIWSGSTESKTLDYHRNNRREHLVLRTHTKKTTEYKTQHHPTISSTLCRMPHLNNKQNKNINPTTSRQDYLFVIRGKTNKQKLSTNLTLYEAYTNHWPNLRRADTKRKKEFNLLQVKNSTFLEVWEKET